VLYLGALVMNMASCTGDAEQLLKREEPLTELAVGGEKVDQYW